GAVTRTGDPETAVNKLPPDDYIQQLVDALNVMFGKKEEPVVSHAGHYLVLKGPDSLVLQIRRFLAIMDSVPPQVQSDLWAVQISGRQDEVTRQADEVARDIQHTRELMLQSLLILRDVIAENKHRIQEDPFFDRLADMGFSPDPDGPLSLIEALVYL